MEWDIDNNEWGMQTDDNQLKILQMKILKTIMNHITVKELWN